MNQPWNDYVGEGETPHAVLNHDQLQANTELMERLFPTVSTPADVAPDNPVQDDNPTIPEEVDLDELPRT